LRALFAGELEEGSLFLERELERGSFSEKELDGWSFLGQQIDERWSV
jgi:hypothetical protein